VGLRSASATAALLAAAGLLSLGLTLAVAGPPDGSKAPPAEAAMSASDLQKAIEDRRQELEGVKQKEQSLKDKERTLQSDVSQLDTEREKLNARLLETAALIQKSEGQMTAIEGRLGELEAQEKILRGSLSERHGEIAELLAALQRMGRNPPPVMITKREDALEMVRSAMLISSAFPQLRRQAVILSGKLEDLTRVITDIRTEGDKLRAETSRLIEMRTRLAGLMAEKKQSITERQAELGQVRQAAAEISKSASDLNELITKLDHEVTRNTALGAYETEAKSTAPPAGAAAALQSGHAPPQEGSGAPPGGKPAELAALTPPPRTDGPPAIELAPAGTSLVPGSPGRIKPAIAFAEARGKLPMPANGKRALSFGEKTSFGNTSQGVVIETRTGAQVTSPCDGWIVYAGEFRSYGQLLIINAGGGYHVLVAGMSQIDVQPGQFVLAAEPVGSMGGLPKSAQPGAETSAPVLYVEFRKDGEPVDPDPWWVAGFQKVQG